MIECEHEPDEGMKEDEVLIEEIRKHVLEYVEGEPKKSALWDASCPARLQFGGRVNLIFGRCQGGKSREICRAAWLAFFCYHTTPFVFVKWSGGPGAGL